MNLTLVFIIVAILALCALVALIMYWSLMSRLLAHTEMQLQEAQDIMARVIKVRVLPGEFLCILMDGERDQLRYIRQEIAKLLVMDQSRVVMLPRDTELLSLSAEQAARTGAKPFPNIETKGPPARTPISPPLYDGRV